MEKFQIKRILGAAFLIAVFYAVYYFINSAGAEKLAELAVEYEFCASVSDCPQSQKDAFVAKIIETTDFTGYRQVQWCLGVDDLSNSKSRRAGIIQYFGYMFCPESTQ